MAPVTVGLGIVLIVLGVGGYGLAAAGALGSGTASPTALIPAAFGLVFLVLGFLARRDALRKHVMHAAAALGLIGFLIPGFMVAWKLPTLWSGRTVERPAATLSQAVMALLCAIFVGLCVRSFISARRARAGGSASVSQST